MRRKRLLAVLGLSMGTLFTGLGAAKAQCPSLPYTLTNGQVADATQVMANMNALASCTNALNPGPINSIAYNAGGGVSGGLGPLTNGQLIIGSTGAAPQAAALTAGPGIAITNGSGSVTISATGASGGSGGGLREFGPFAPPDASSFTFIDSPSSITPTVSNVADVGLVYSVPVTGDSSSFPGAYQAAPTATPWMLTIRSKYAVPMGNYPEFGIWIKDTAGKMIGAVMEAGNGTISVVAKHCNSNVSYNSNAYASGVADAPDWIRVGYDGTNINFYVSWDGQNWIKYWTETGTSFLNGTLQYVGIGGLTGITNTSLWQPGSQSGAIVTYWNMSTP